MDEYTIKGNPDYLTQNEANPYDAQVTSSTRGEPYTTDLAGRSTLVSDNMEMTRRLKAFVPRSSAKGGREPAKFGEGANKEEENEGSSYKSKFQ